MTLPFANGVDSSSRPYYINTTESTVTVNGESVTLHTLVTAPANGSGDPMQVQGTAAENTPVSGNPVYLGSRAGVINTYTNGNAAPLSSDLTGNLRTLLVCSTTAGADAVANTLARPLTPGSSSGNASIAVAGYVFNGTNWDRQRGDTNGTYVQSGTLPAATDRSGTATTTSAQLAAANAARRGLEIQNIGANNIGINEFGGTAAIGTAGTYTVTPGSSIRVRTNRAINVIAATASTAFTATEF